MDTPNGTSQRCAARTKANQPCGGYAVADSQFCFAHSPQAARSRAAARAKGGRRSRPGHNGDPAHLPARVRSVDDALAVLDFALAEAAVLENGVARGRLLVALASQYIAAIQTSQNESRLTELENWVADFLAKGRTR